MTPLGRQIAAMIEADGPIGVDRFMALALGHPVHGYYRSRDPLGATGDFTTAPEISQIFGELIGLWAAQVWQGLGAPTPCRLIELGPGRGTLMADALRAARVLPTFCGALDVHFVETSPVLREAQRRAMGSSPVTWHDTIDSVPSGPALVIANEFFDALPIRQVVRTERGWCERLVGIKAGRLAFGLAPGSDPAVRAEAPLGAVLEICPLAVTIMADLAQRVVAQGGAVLATDYGGGGSGDTLQAVARHVFVDPLEAPGEADLTAHVDFAALAQAARRSGARVHGPVRQGVFLRRLGLETRVARLAAGSPGQADAIQSAAVRLIAADHHPGDGRGMGQLFQVMAVTAADMAAVPGFEETA